MTADTTSNRGFALPLVLLVGVLLRVAAWWVDRSLWSDEAALAVNVIGRSVGELAGALDHAQAAPYGFLVLERALFELFGDAERVLRALPLAAGVGALLVFAQLARRAFPGRPRVVLLGVLLFAVGEPLVRYSAEVKPYALDVLVAVLLTLLTERALRELRGGAWPLARAVELGFAGAVAVWLSFPAVFVLAGAAPVLALRARKRVVIPFALWAVGFAAVWRLHLSQVMDHAALFAFWSGAAGEPGAPAGGAFAPLLPTSTAELRWYTRNFFELFADPAGLPQRGLAAFAFLAGCSVLRRERPGLLGLLLLPLAFALGASALELYPFHGRLLLFAAPALVLVVSRGAVEVFGLLAARARPIAVAFAAVLLFHPLGGALRDLRHPPRRAELRPLLARVVPALEPGDQVYVYHQAQTQLAYYGPRFGLGTDRVRLGIRSSDDWARYREDLAPLTAGERAWLVFSHEHPGEKPYLLTAAGELGRFVEAVEEPGASAYLFRF